MDRDAQKSAIEQPQSSQRLPASKETTSLLRGNRELAVLYAIASQLNRKVEVREMLQEVLLQVTQLFGLQTGWVWLLDEEHRPYVAAALALPPYLADHYERMAGSCLCLDTFLAGSLAGAANIDVFRCSRLKNAEREGDPSSWGLRFHASVPIYAGETPLGVLNVASEDWRELAEDELQLLHIVSDQIGLAIQRARLAEEHMRAATRLATIEERNRLAREFHDTLAQGLAAITLQLETADVLTEQKSERAGEAIRRALSLARANLEEARRAVIDLRAAPLRNHTLSEALQELAQEMQHDNLAISYRSTPTEFPLLSPRLETSLYRLAQEALTNVKKHAQARHVQLSLTLEGHELYLYVDDDGCGFQVEAAMEAQSHFGGQTGHFGLTGVSERVKLLGGTLCIGSAPSTGTCFVVCVPLEKDGTSDDPHFAGR
ncbi:MAG: GAF domain-containing sensor histidine kinase [Ktedonobacteraceae bacterium]